MKFTPHMDFKVPGTDIDSVVTGLSYGEQREYEELVSRRPEDGDAAAMKAWQEENQKFLRACVIAHWLDKGGKPLLTEEILDSRDGPTPGQFYGAWGAIMRLSMRGAETLGAEFRNGEGEAGSPPDQAPRGDVRAAPERAPEASGG